MTVRLAASAILITVVVGSCSNTDPVGDYSDSVRGITLTMRNESIAAISDGQPITRDGIIGVIAARQRALTALQAVVPPPAIAAEHAALLRVLAEFSTVAETFMESTADLDPAGFEQAVLAATYLDTIVARVGTACDAVVRRAFDLDVAVDLAC